MKKARGAMLLAFVVQGTFINDFIERYYIKYKHVLCEIINA